MLVKVASFSFPFEAQIARARLESEGIPASVADEHTINMQWLYSDALGGVKLMVPPAFAEQAVEILAEDRSAALVVQKGEDKQRCHSCGSLNTEFFVKGRRPAFLVFLFLHFPLWPFKRQVKCDDCGVVSNYNNRPKL